MKVFKDKESSWHSKVNFVDDNNVFVGFDTEQDGCEYADWFFSDEVSKKVPEECDHNDKGLEGFVFDKNYFEEVIYIENANHPYNELEDGKMVIFRLTNGEEEKFLHLFNVHNGYYGHGFEVKHGGEIVREGTL